jgi:hypothetical protein
MNEQIKLTRKIAKPVLDATFPEYNGRKIKVEFAKTLTFYDLNWSGGTRNKYVAIRSDGLKLNLIAPAPWDNPYEDLKVDIPADVIVVKHAHFCGKDCGITIYVNPDSADLVRKQIGEPAPLLV